MGWFLGLAVLIGFAWLMYSNSAFRKFGLGLICFVIGAAVVLWFLEKDADRKRDLARQQALEAINPVELEFADLTLADEGYGWRIKGNVLNRSAYPIRQLTLRIYLQECPQNPDRSECITTGQDDAVFYVEVPPGQAREINASVALDNAANLGAGWTWQYAVAAIEADLDSGAY